jgi:hypothetical protein
MLAAFPRFASGGEARKRKKRGKCEIVPLFDERVLFFTNPLSPHPHPQPLSTSGEGSILHSPSSGRERKASGSAVKKGFGKK